MSPARRLLIVGGIGLAVLGMIYGVWYAVFAEHQELDGIAKSLTASFSAAAKGDSRAAGAALKDYKELKYRYDRHVDVHGHWIGLAMLLIVLGIGLDRAGLNEQMKKLLATALVVGSLLFPLGVLMQTFSHATWPQMLAVGGSALVIASLLGMTLGFARAKTSD